MPLSILHIRAEKIIILWSFLCLVQLKEHLVAKFNFQHKAVLDNLSKGLRHVRPGKIFGYTACYAGRKLCICLYEQGVGVKVPEQSEAKLLEMDGNTVPFRPLGKPKMREWVQINPGRSGNYRKYKSVFDDSIRYMPAQQEKVDS